MEFRLTWTLGGHGLQVDVDRGKIDFTSIQFHIHNVCGRGL